MKAHFYAWSFALLFPLCAAAQTCVPEPGSEARGRVQMTHRAPAPRRTLIATTSVATMAVWIPPSGLTERSLREQDRAIDPFEDRAFTFTGDLWRLRYDEACNLHLELSAAGHRARDPRVIAVIPVGAPYDQARLAVLSRLPPAGLPGTPGTRVLAGGPRRPLELATPLRVVLTAYAYFDTAHWSPTATVRGLFHGSARVVTLWELRPVWRANFVHQCAADDTRCQAERAERR